MHLPVFIPEIYTYQIRLFWFATQLDEDGKPINPHIPQFMASAPWYLYQDQPTLKHQKNWKSGSGREESAWYDRGAKVFQATKYRKGACTKYVVVCCLLVVRDVYDEKYCI